MGMSYMLSPDHNWWKNLRGNVPLTVWYKGKKCRAVADAVQGDESVVNAILAAIKTQAGRRDGNISPQRGSRQRWLE